MQMAAYVEQNFMYTSKAYDLGRGERTDVVPNRKFERPGPGTYESSNSFSLVQNGKYKGFEYVEIQKRFSTNFFQLTYQMLFCFLVLEQD